MPAHGEALCGLLAASNALDGLRRMIEGQAIADVAVWSNFVSTALVGSLVLSRSTRHHAGITILTIVLFLLFLVQEAVAIA